MHCSEELRQRALWLDRQSSNATIIGGKAVIYLCTELYATAVKQSPAIKSLRIPSPYYLNPTLVKPIMQRRECSAWTPT